jgi:sn-glycerol 3-phosphate transport system ATP-binding protein/multiple sugar transport system ATP-binding protein
VLGFRAEAVRLDAFAGTGTGSAPGSAPGVVDRVDVVGEDAHVHLRVDGHDVVARVPAADRPAVGDELGVTVRWAVCHVFDAVTGQRITER